MTESPQSMVIARPHRQLHHFQRPAQVDVQARLLRFPVQRRRAVNDRVRSFHQSPVVIVRQAELLLGDIPTKNVNAGVQVIVKSREIQMQLQGPPQAHFRLVRVRRPHQNI